MTTTTNNNNKFCLPRSKAQR